MNELVEDYETARGERLSEEGKLRPQHTFHPSIS